MYIVNGWVKYSEHDDYQKGVIGKASMFSGKESFQANDIPTLIDKLKAFTNHDDVILDSCNEIGRLDIQGMETSGGYPATPLDIERWKRGTKILYAVTYTFYVYKCEPVSLLGE